MPAFWAFFTDNLQRRLLALTYAYNNSSHYSPWISPVLMSFMATLFICIFLGGSGYVCMFVITISVSVHHVSTARKGGLWKWVGSECKSVSVCVCVSQEYVCVLSCQSRYEVVNVYERLCPCTHACVCIRHCER